MVIQINKNRVFLFAVVCMLGSWYLFFVLIKNGFEVGGVFCFVLCLLIIYARPVL